jgi:hypothetical protein
MKEAEHCHAEHIRYAQCKLREVSGRRSRETLRCAQGDTEGKHQRDAIARQHGQVLLNHALVWYNFTQLASVLILK